MKEPVRWLVGGGVALVQAILQLLIAFGVPITGPMDAAITAVAGMLIAEYTRSHVTPMSSLPPGVAGKIADAKAVADAKPAEVKP